MVLGEKAADRFYGLLSPLADYVNMYCNMYPELLGTSYGRGDHQEERARVLARLWDSPRLIDDYLAEDGSALPEEDREAIAAWKRFIRGRFILMKYCKGGALLLGAEEKTKSAFLVSGLRTNWKTTLRRAGLRLPVAVDTVLVPFEGVIVSHGYMDCAPIAANWTQRMILSGMYRVLRRDGAIRRTL